MATVLIIDDDPEILDTLSLMVERMGHQSLTATRLAQGLETTRDHEIDVVFLDVRLPDGSGLDALPRIERAPSLPEVIILTGFGDPKGAELAIKSGAWDYLEKTASAKEINLALDRALQYRREKQTARRGAKISALKREGIVGESRPLRASLELVAQAALGEADVLITGETGTGKELFARAIHNNSRRAGGPFIVVDCAALPENLVEALLFGHEKGTFTGAEKTRQGLIAQADGGTLFLDEVGELPLTLQKTFLRVLQERRFRPLGGSQEQESDFRLVAATNRDLNALVQRQEFREDLLFRLRSFHIELPPLRERLEDVRDLARAHLDQLCVRKGIAAKDFSPDFVPTLQSYSWPGNIRELLQTLERALDAAFLETTLFPKHLPTALRAEIARCTLSGKGEMDPSLPQAILPTLQEFRESIYQQAEKQYLRELLALTEHNIQKACRLAGLSQSRLYALLKEHKIPRSND